MRVRQGICGRLLAIAVALAPAWGAGLAGPAAAQGLFSPVITVNDDVITRFELEQRQRLLEFFNTPGNTAAQARTGLVEDRLKRQELNRAGLALTEDGLRLAVGELAQRANLTAEQLEAVVQQNGIAIETLHDFVLVQATWRELVRARYNPRITVTEAEIDAELARTENANAAIEVLLSEIILPAPPQEAAQAQATALRLSQITSTAAFSAEARSLSAVPSRERGGQLDWVPITNFPPPLQNILLGLSPGEVTPPLPITNGIALLQLRSLREAGYRPAQPVEIDYAVHYIPGGRSPEALAEAARITARADSCDDLYGILRDLPAERLDRVTLPPAGIPQDVALELARLDPGEVSVGLTSTSGDTLLMLMLCNRSFAPPEGATRENVSNAIRARKLARYADALVAELRAAAVIVGE
jgi:peptidyl-prolyl cis-trans isomerase SurA